VLLDEFRERKYSMGIRIGLIGAGRMGKVYVSTLAFSVPEVDLVAVADPVEETLAEVKTQYRIPNGFVDYRQLLDRSEIDAVVIAAPTGLHSEVVQAAAKAGKHIFCEKPLSQHLAGCDSAIQAVRQAGVKLQMGFMRHFDPPYRSARARIDAGEIGKPVMFKSISRDPHRTSLEFARRENSGGMIMDMGVHDFDLARWLMASEVDRLFSLGGCLAYPELNEVGDIDNALIDLHFADGAIGNIDLSRNAVYGYDIRTEILGTEGSLWIGYLQQTPVLVLNRQGVTHDTVPYFMERFGLAYREQIKAFAHHILEDTQPEVSGGDARAATAIGIAATLSLDEQRPVSINEINA
jgi:myo-inositol 2-dehydrogenase/D-chiro-inositol 1-dehydrogenase